MMNIYEEYNYITATKKDGGSFLALCQMALDENLFIPDWAIERALRVMIASANGYGKYNHLDHGISVALCNGEPVGVCIYYGANNTIQTFVNEMYRRSDIGTTLMSNIFEKFSHKNASLGRGDEGDLAFYKNCVTKIPNFNLFAKGA
jgi:hypothetical protein